MAKAHTGPYRLVTMPSTDKQRSHHKCPRFHSAGLQPIALVVITLAVIACNRGPSVREGESPVDALTRIETDIAARYSDVAQLDRDALSRLIENGTGPILVDVREPSEHRVSHIRGAIRVEPGAGASEILAKVGDADGRAVVFYCSVGERSSAMAQAAATRLSAAGATTVYNLQGGIFGWSNDQRPLVDELGATSSVHPFNDRWGQLLSNRSAIRRQPRNRAPSGSSRASPTGSSSP